MKPIVVIASVFIVQIGQSQTFTLYDDNFLQIDQGSASWGDFDGDQDLDVFVMGDDYLSLMCGAGLYENQSGTFVLTSGLIVDPCYTTGLKSTWADIDLDGDQDLIAGIYVFENNAGILTVVDTLPPLPIGAMDLGDFDNDNDLDIALQGSSWTEYQTIILKNNSNQFDLHQDLLDGYIYGSLDWGDYDNDGDLDLVITGDPDNSGILPFATKVYRNDAGVFVHNNSLNFQGVRHGDAKWQDFDMDNDLDLIVCGDYTIGSPTYVTRLYVNNGGVFNDSIEINGIAEPKEMIWVDLDTNQIPDLVIYGANNSKIFMNNGDGSFDEINGFFNSFSAAVNPTIEAGDFDLDGDVDLLYSGGFKTQVYSNNGVYNVDTTNTLLEYLHSFITVFPNPFYSQLVLEMDSEFLPCELIISDLGGRVVYSTQVSSSNTIVPLDDKLDKGVYIISIVIDGKINYKEKVIKI